MLEILKSFFFLFAVIDPLGSIPVYLEATKQFDSKERKKIAIRASIIASFVLLFFILLGQVIMDIMKISMDAFQISGGVILFLFALTMVFGEGKPTSEKGMIKDHKHVTVFPIAIPSLASPGAIMAVVLLTDNHVYTIEEQVITVTMAFVVMFITCLLLLLAKNVQDKINDAGIVVISKIMGLILASFAIQSILTGIKEYFKIG